MHSSFATKRRLGGAALAVAMLVAAGMMQQPGGSVAEPGRPIKSIVFEGLRGVAESYVRSVIQSTEGEPFDPQRVEDDVTRLLKTRKFEDVRAEPRGEGGEVVIVYRFEERPLVESLEFIGNEKFKTSELQSEVELAIGAPISEFAIRQGQQNIERKYKEAGYFYATVEIDRGALAERRVVFTISEGPRVRVREIEFDGNTAFTDRKLRSKIETKRYVWILRTGEFDGDRAERDAAAVQTYYKDKGYLDARVGYRVDFRENGRDLTLTFLVDEGVQYRVKSIAFKGNAIYSSDDLASSLTLAPEAVFEKEIVEADVKRLVDRYGEAGYIYAGVQTDWVYSSQDAYVDVTFNIGEREQYRFGRIVIRGNAQTKDRVVRRELRFQPEELYDTVRVRQAEQRLVETRLFNTATITPVGDTPEYRDALVRVEEADNISVLFGVGVSSNNGLGGSIMIENRNFDLFDWPRNSTELFKGKAFRGAGQTFRMQLEPGTEFTRARVDFREPYFLDQDVGFGTGVYLFDRGRDEWDERRIGFNISFDRRFRYGVLKNWAGEVALRFEDVKIDGLDFWTPDEIRDTEGHNWLTSAKGTLVRDTTDSRFLPSRGNRFSVAYEQVGALGGDWTFGKLTSDFAQHFTVHTDTTDRKHVVSLGASGGQIFGDAPPFERFFAGGIGSIRGFDFRGVSPRAGFQDDRVGGDFELLANAEYSFPLISDTVRGVAFLDMGTVEEDFGITDWRASVGLGARIYVKFFGPIPLAFDFGFPISSDGEDDEQVFSFSFGTTF